MEDLLKILAENPETLTLIAKQYIDKYKPIAYGLLHEILEIYKDYSNNTEFPELKAKVSMNMYKAYVNSGFTEEQALALMINDNIQLMNNIHRISNTSNKAESK